MVHRKFQPVFVLIVIVLFFVQGCAGRAAHPVKVAQSGDNKKTCKSLRKETKKNQAKYKKNDTRRQKGRQEEDSSHAIRRAIDCPLVFSGFK